MPGYLHDIFNLPIAESGSFTSLAEGILNFIESSYHCINC